MIQTWMAHIKAAVDVMVVKFGYFNQMATESLLEVVVKEYFCIK